jgi:hypothetical protein
VAKPARWLFCSRTAWIQIVRTGSTPLHHFASHGDIDNAAFYIDHGADLEARTAVAFDAPARGRTGQKRMVEYLLRRGAKVSPLVRHGRSRSPGPSGGRAPPRIRRTATLPKRTLSRYEELANTLSAAPVTRRRSTASSTISD